MDVTSEPYIDSSSEDESVVITMTGASARTNRRRRRRRRRGGGRRAAALDNHWWKFAPHPTDEDGDEIKADEKGFPVMLPSGQAVFLLHDAKNPEYAATFLAEKNKKPAQAKEGTSDDSSNSDPELLIESLENDIEAEDEVSAQASPHFDACVGRARCEAGDHEDDLWDDVDDGALSFCSDLSSGSLSSFFCTGSSKEESAVDESALDDDTGDSDASFSSGFSVCSSASLGAASAFSWGSFHDCIDPAKARRMPSENCVAELAAAAVLRTKPAVHVSGSMWGEALKATLLRSAHWEDPSVFEIDPLPELSGMETAADLDFLACNGDAVDALTATEAEWKALKREERRLAKASEAEERKRLEKDRRRVEHEKRTRRNQLKRERRAQLRAQETFGGMCEIDAALSEFGLC